MKYLIAISAVVTTIGITTIPLVWGDNDDRWNKDHESRKATTTVSMPAYKEECGSCHMPYPSGLLPARSWKKVMSQLEDHFGDNAELDTEIHQTISNFLEENSSDNSNYR